MACILVFCAGSQAQRMRISTGAGIIHGKGQVPAGADEITEQPVMTGYGLFLYPRFNITESESGALSIGMPVMIGMGGKVNFSSGASINFIADVPLTIDYNFGSGSTKENMYGFGFFLGGGFGYTYTNKTYEYNSMGSPAPEKMSGISYGPLAHAGIKVNISEKIYFIRAFYKMGMETEKYRLYGGSIGVSF